MQEHIEFTSLEHRMLSRRDHTAKLHPIRQTTPGRDALTAALRFGSDVLGWLLALCLGWVLAFCATRDPSLEAVRQGSLAGIALTAPPALAVAGYFAMQGHYTRRHPFWFELRQLLLGTGFGLLFTALLAFLMQSAPSRVLVVTAWIAFPVTALCLRQLTRRVMDRCGLWRIPTLIVGHGESAQRVIAALASEPALGYEVVGQVGLHAVADQRMHQSWRSIMNRSRAELVVLAVDHDNRPAVGTIEALGREGVSFAVVPPDDGLPVLDCVRTYFFSHDTVLLTYRNNLMRPIMRQVKIAFDLSAAFLLVLFLAPVLLAIAAAVKMDGGPVFFAHKRIGVGGTRFGCLKFRSMVTNSAEVLEDLLARDPAAAAEWAATQKLRNDPRITRVGAVLRATSLDELPQLFNVLRLEMSLVGPRPIVDKETRHYGNNLAYYLEARPGITGLWQVSGRSDTTYAQRVQLDSWYVKNWSLWHDIAILAKTIPAVLLRRGAV